LTKTGQLEQEPDRSALRRHTNSLTCTVAAIYDPTSAHQQKIKDPPARSNTQATQTYQ
jgi:hypothetical protein